MSEKYIITQMKGTGMKYLFFIVLMIAVVITAGCVVQNNNPPVAPTPQIVYVTVLVTPTQTVYPTSTSQSVYIPLTPVTVNPSGSRITEVVTSIAALDAELQIYRTHIDEKAALGIDTSAAELKYREAVQKINSVRSRPSNQYTEALGDLNAASVAIRDGETALDKAWAEYEFAAAQVPINKVNIIIAWFKGNPTTANDQQLPSIITKREMAMSYISNANVNFAQGNFVQARQKAQDAFLKANESYTEALARQKQIVSGV